MSVYATTDAPAQPPPPPGAFVVQPGYGPPQMQMMPIQNAPGPYMTTQAITTQPGAYHGQQQPGAYPGQGRFFRFREIAANIVACFLTAAIWMPMPAPMDGVPAGLEYLTMVDKIMVHQVRRAQDCLQISPLSPERLQISPLIPVKFSPFQNFLEIETFSHSLFCLLFPSKLNILRN